MKIKNIKDLNKIIDRSVGFAGQGKWCSLKPANPEKYAGFVYAVRREVERPKYYIGGKYYKIHSMWETEDGGVEKSPNYGKPYPWRDYWGSSATLRADIDKYGEDNFTKVIISEWLNPESISQEESYLQSILRVLIEIDPKTKEDLYYNQFIGESFKPSPVVSLELRNKFRSINSGESHPMYGKTGYRLTAPNGERFEVQGGFTKFCVDRGLCNATLRKIADKKPGYYKHHGWTAEFLEV